MANLRPALLLVFAFLLLGCTSPPSPEIKSFEDCVRAGYPVMESFPRQCRTPDGRIFVSRKDAFDIGNVSCQSDSDCVLVDSELGFRCCYAGQCEAVDYSLGKWTAVSSKWYSDGTSKYCPAPQDCGPAPMCNPKPVNEDYSARCIAKECRKVPNACTNDADCGPGASCWSALPAGPSAGTKGSRGDPGKCWDDSVVNAIVSPAGESGLKERCCSECAAAFSRSPVGSGPDSVKCGYFTTAEPMSDECTIYFKQNTSTPAQCGYAAEPTPTAPPTPTEPASPTPPEPANFTEGICNTLNSSGPMANKLNIIFIPSHQYSDMSDFAHDVPAFRDSLLSMPFYSASREKLNFFFLADERDDDGCEILGNTTPACNMTLMRDFASGCSFDASRGDQLVVIFDNRAVATPYARGEIGQGILFIGSDSAGIFPHEFSHSFGGLADTYDGYWNNTAEPSSPNCASATPGFTCADKWGDLIGTGSGDQLVGCYANCDAENWYRPTLG
ncbi:MAG TPA: hypothetical protein VLD37_00005, partial [Candidatus Bilamarchaeum sp.]|nr:hypothetical protein [Candidatus Bilamarchaeum sp.]